ncbi:hypothetical protein D9756_000207 [Leucocoprinus leucothites]|uniref:Uncharacterized protein n=1 Tax=Leucocoprinus leucothites TaxID=201217 RepID=A0A8H5GEG9_9AGAR|nr:hypothetical protein D9756_000207 [Leucoagaricus leucothites]
MHSSPWSTFFLSSDFRVVLHIREQIELQSNAEFNEDLAHSQSDWLQGMVAPATRRVSFPSNTGV